MKIRKVRKNFVTIVDQRLTRDDRLSWKARGIFYYLWSQADNWDFNATEVSRHATDGRKSLDTGLDELERFGYLKRERKRNKLGQLTTSDWQLSDLPVEAWIKDRAKPIPENRKLDQPISGFPNLDNPNLENGEQSKHQEKITSKEDNIKLNNNNNLYLYLHELRLQPSDGQMKRFLKISDGISEDLIKYSIELTDMYADKPSLKYAGAIIKQWKRLGIKSLQEAKRREMIMNDDDQGDLNGVHIPIFKLMDQ